MKMHGPSYKTVVLFHIPAMSLGCGTNELMYFALQLSAEMKTMYQVRRNSSDVQESL
jgi:hypothetical protein